MFELNGFDCEIMWRLGQEREVQKSYWIEHTAELTVEAMMLDSKAADLDKEERPEVYDSFYDIVMSNISLISLGCIDRIV